MSRFLKVASASSAALALLAGTAMTSAFAAEETPAPAETTAAAPAADTVNAWFQPGQLVKTSDGLFVMVSMGLESGPDGSIGGGGGVANYDASKIKLELVDDNTRLKASVNDAIAIPAGTDTTYINAIGIWETSDASVVSVDSKGALTAGKDGTATVTFTPMVIKDNTATYPDTKITADVTVAGGKVTSVTSAAPAPEQPEEGSNVPGEGTKISLPDGLLFATNGTPELAEDGTATGLTTLPLSAFEGSNILVRNLDTLKVGDVVDAKFEYTNAAGYEDIKKIYDGSADAALFGEWTSSDTKVVSVSEDGTTLKAVGAGTTTLTFTPVTIKDGVVVKSEKTFTYVLTVPGEAPAETPAPVPTTEAPAQTTEAPAPAVEPTSDPAAVVPAPAEAPFVYQNCAAVYEAGAAPIYAGQYGWDDSLDADSDGVGCEDTPDYTNDAYQTANYADGSQSELANTGAEATVPFVAGLGLLALGTGAVVYSRRRAS